MLDPSFARALADIGGFALFLFGVIVAGVGLWRRWWVPGWMYQQERDARLVAETQAVRNAEMLTAILRMLKDDRRRGSTRDT